MAYTTIDDPSAYFQTALYSSDSSSVTVTNDGNSDLQPDWIWIKVRNGTNNHNTFDTSRGIANRLKPNDKAVEDGSSGVSVSSDGFATGTSLGDINNTGGANNYVAWQWKANGGTTATNNNGDVTTTVQANTTAGFSIVTYTGNGSSGATIGHGLGAVPHLFIGKQRSNAENWIVYHHKNTSAPETDFLSLNTADATADNANAFNDTAPTSSVMTLGGKNEVNTSGRTYVGYFFTEIQGYSKFGSYIGNSNADGAFVYTGFKPAFVLVTASNAAENWLIVDNKRTQSFNPVDGRLIPNSNAAEETNITPCDLLSNGIKWRTSDGVWNSSSNTHIYMAFAEHPFVSSKGVPTTAR